MELICTAGVRPYTCEFPKRALYSRKSVVENAPEEGISMGQWYMDTRARVELVRDANEKRVNKFQ